MRALPHRYRACALNLLYYKYGGPAKEPTIAGLARAVLEFAGERPVILVGHSMGGVIAQYLAVHGAPIEKLILIGTGPNMKDHPLGNGILEAAERDGFSPAFLESTMRRFFKSPPADLSEYTQDVVLADPEILRAAVRSLFVTDLESELGKILCPALIVHGRYDAARSLAHAGRLLKGIPDSRLALFDTGHSPMLEAPDEFNEALIEFIGGQNEST